MARGVVKWFDGKKGYGFIQSEEFEQDIFVHFSNIIGDGFKKLKFGDAVEFECSREEGKLQAVNVRPEDPQSA